jgi:hypothetical protein
MGIDHPDINWTVEDLREAGEMATIRNADGTIERYGGAFRSAHAMERQFYNLERFGGAFVRHDEPTKCLMDLPESQEALEWLRARYWDDETWMPRLLIDATGGRAVRDGFTSFEEEGGPYYAWVRDAGEFWKINLMHPPIGPAERTSYMVTDGFGMWSGTKWPDATWECMQFLAGPVYQEIRMRASGRIAVRMSAMEKYKEAFIELEPSAADGYNLDIVLEGLAMGYGRDDERFLCQAEAEEIINPLLQKIFMVGDAPVSVLADACPDVEAVQTCEIM